MAEFVIRQGDTASPIASVLRDANLDPVDITGAAITFRMQEIGAPSVHIDAAANNDQTGLSGVGAVSYDWQPGDTDEPGLYEGVFRATFGDGSVQSFPNGGYVLIRVTADLPKAASAPFASTSELEDRLGVTLTADEHARAHRLLLAATEQIRNATGQTISLTTDAQLVSPGTYGARLRLPQRPVVAVDPTILLDGVEVASATWYLEGDELVRVGGWGGPASAIDVLYTHGYDVIPAVIKQVTLEMVVRVWVNPGSVTQEGYGVEQVSYPASPGLMMTDAERTAVLRAVGRAAGSVVLR